MSDLSAAFGKPFAQQVAAFRIRLAQLQATKNWKDVWQSEHDRTFMVAGAEKAELLADFAAAIDKAIGRGTSLEEFRRDFEKAVTDHNWHGWAGEETEKGRAWRTRVIYRTNLSTSYAAGRYAQLKEAGFPYWIYFHGNSAEPRLQHLAWNGLILPSDHPFWATHYPPNGWGCSCYVIGARSMAGAIRRGGNPALKLQEGWDARDPKTLAPKGIDKGWGYAPGASVARTLIPIVDKLAALPAPIGADLVGGWQEQMFAAWSGVFAGFVSDVLSQPPRGRMMIVGAMKQNWLTAMSSRGMAPASAEIAVTDKEIWHTFRDTKVRPLDITWYQQLPTRLRKPDIVLFDTTDVGKPALLLIYDLGPDAAKLVVKVDYKLKKAGILNVIETGRRLSVADLNSMRGLLLTDGQTGQGYYEIEGKL